jgi:hypothetical protein
VLFKISELPILKFLTLSKYIRPKGYLEKPAVQKNQIQTFIRDEYASFPFRKTFVMADRRTKEQKDRVRQLVKNGYYVCGGCVTPIAHKKDRLYDSIDSIFFSNLSATGNFTSP